MGQIVLSIPWFNQSIFVLLFHEFDITFIENDKEYFACVKTIFNPRKQICGKICNYICLLLFIFVPGNSSLDNFLREIQGGPKKTIPKVCRIYIIN